MLTVWYCYCIIRYSSIFEAKLFISYTTPLVFCAKIYVILTNRFSEDFTYSNYRAIFSSSCRNLKHYNVWTTGKLQFLSIWRFSMTMCLKFPIWVEYIVAKVFTSTKILNVHVYIFQDIFRHHVLFWILFSAVKNYSIMFHVRQILVEHGVASVFLTK